MILLNKEHLESSLKQLKNYVSKTETRPALTGIHVFSTGDNKVILEATDSFRALKVELENRGEPEEFDFIMQPVTLTKNFKVDTLVKVDYENCCLEGNLTGTKVFLTMIQEPTYPDMSRCMDVPGAEKVATVNVGFLKSLVAGLGNNDTIDLSIVAGKPYQPLVFKAHQEYENKILICTRRG